MFSLQVQEALEAPNNPGEAEQTKCEPESYPRGWREQESDGTREPWNDQDEFSALLGVEHLYPGLNFENGPEETDCKVQEGVTNTHCRKERINTRNEVNTHQVNTNCGALTDITQETLSLSINGLNTVEPSTQPDQGAGELNTQHVNTYHAQHATTNNTDVLKTQDTENIDITGKACIGTNNEERAGSQTTETKGENIAELKRKDYSEPYDGRQSSSTKYCGETCLKVSTGPQRTDVFSLNDSGKHNLESTSICSAEIHKDIRSNINTHLDRLHNADDKHIRKPEIHSFDSNEVDIRDTGAQNCSQDSEPHHKNSNNPDAHCPETFVDTEGTTCVQQRHNIKSRCINFEHKPPPSQDDVCNGKADDSLSRSELKRINCNGYSSHTRATNECGNTSGVKGKALNTAVHCKDTPIVLTTCKDCNVAEIAPSKTEEYCSRHLNTCDGDTKSHDTLCVSGIKSLHLGTEPVNSPGSGLPQPSNGNLLPAYSEETAAETLLHTEAEKQLQKTPHDQQQELESRFLPCSTDCEDVDGIFWLNSPVTATENKKATLSDTRGCKQFVARINRFEEKVWEDSSFTLTLSAQSTSVEKLAEGTTLLQIHNECKDINSHSPELLISSSHSCERSHCSLSTEEKVKERSQELTRSEDVEDSLYPKHGQSIEDELASPLHSAKSNHCEIRTENCVSSKPVETQAPLFTVCQPTHTHEQCVNVLNNHTLFIDFKHKRSTSSPQGNVTEIPFPETSVTKTVGDSKASFAEKDNPQSDKIGPCWNLSVYNSTASEKSTEAVEAVVFCNPWLEPFSDGPESGSEDGDQTSHLALTFKKNEGALQQGLVSLDGLKKRSDVLCPVDWSSEDSAVSGLGEDLESIHCDFYPPQVENREQPTQKEYLENNTCLRSECNIVTTGDKLHNDQKCHIDSHLIQSVPNGLGPFTHSRQCKDINHIHIHTSLCDCIPETDLDSLRSQPHQPCIDVLQSSPGYLETQNPVKQGKQKELSSSTQLISHNGIRTCGEKDDSSLTLSGVKTIHYTQSEVLLSSRSLEPIPETDCSLDNVPNPNDDTFLGDKKTETEKFDSDNMKPSESDQDILGVASCVHRLSVCKGNF